MTQPPKPVKPATKHEAPISETLKHDIADTDASLDEVREGQEQTKKRIRENKNSSR